jgi:serine phosphatase RsbU (regulator of sigma subunit)
MKTVIFKCCFLFFIFNAFSFITNAKELDSLMALLPHAKDTQIALLNLHIGKIYSKQKNYQVALEYFNKGEKVSIENNYIFGQALAFQYMAKLYSRMSSFDTSQVFYEKALTKFEGINRPENKIELMNDYAILYYHKGDYHKSIKICFKALNVNYQIKDQKLISRIYNNLGNCYYFLSDFNNALKFYTKAYEIEFKLSNKIGMANSLGNIGLIYYELGNYEASLNNHYLSYNLQVENSDTNEMAASLINLSMVYEKLNQPEKALKYTQESLKLRRLIKDDRRIALSLIRVATLTLELGNYSEAKALFEEAIKISERNNSKQYILEAHQGLSILFEKQGNYKEALKNYKIYTSYKDSIYTQKNAEEIAEAQEKYESEKKQKALEILKKDQLINQIYLEKNKTYLYITFFIIVSIIILLLLLYRQFKLKQKSNVLLASQNTLITAQKKEITDSINYASIIQRAILPLDKEFNRIFPNSFVTYLPKDIVSGDFYWCKQKENKKIIVVADCTGHGVPGAMMSMIGTNILNQAFNDLNNTSPGDFLQFLDKGISESLHQNDAEQTTKNSMDLSICIIDEKLKTISYGGSMNPIYLVRNKVLEIYKTDKLPIGYNFSNNHKVFNSYTINFQKGDRIYLFTDGIPDQFGGEKGKKLMSKNFQKMLIQIQEYEIFQQAGELNKLIRLWKGNYDQTDDMLLVGIQL